MDIETLKKLGDFFDKFPISNYKKGETIIRSDDEPAGVYYLKEGFVKMNSIFENGSELTLNIFKPKSFFPMTWAIGDIKNTYYFLAMANSTVHKAPKNKVVEFLKENPDILFDLTKRILIGLDGLLTNVSHLLFGSAQNRVASAILISAKRFGDKKVDGKITINLNLTHQDIANLAGLTRETTSIAIGQLEKAGILSQIKHQFVVNDIEKLEEEIFISENIESAPSTI